MASNPVLINNIVQHLENSVISVESLAILLVHAEEGHEVGEDSSSNQILSAMVLLRRCIVNCQATPIGAKKFFAHLHLIHGGQSKTVKAQIDLGSTCNTMSSSLLRQLFPNVKISKMKSRISTYGSQTMKPKGQVTLVCERKGKLHIIDFLVVNVSGNNFHFLVDEMHKL